MITKKIMALLLGISAFSCSIDSGVASKAVDPILKASKTKLVSGLSNTQKNFKNYF